MEFLIDPSIMLMMIAGVGAALSILTLGFSLVDNREVQKRMKSLATERDQLRVREREKMAAQKGSLRHQEKPFVKRVVDAFNLSKYLGEDWARSMLTMAGFRAQSAENTFLFFRMVTPIIFLLSSLFYVFVIADLGQPPIVKIGICILLGYVGFKAPQLYLKNLISKRQLSMRRAFPDGLDLLLICVESGMSIEHAFRKVSSEIATQSLPLAEEFTLMTAELSYLPDRRQAYENLANRTGLESIKNVVTALNQAEKYGTPLGTALRVMSQESRDQRMNEAEKKAAALPPKLTVPMILFFLPVLFIVILTPAMIAVFAPDALEATEGPI
jgi:tight adherence protein C